jgi:SAM-dependent methyltransferase
VFGEAGFEVTVADISDCLLAFAAFRCRQRGLKVRTIDLKSESLPPQAFDLAVCFDVLEHIPDPLPVVSNIRSAMRECGIVAIHAPFGEDHDHPMHVAHHDAVSPKMRSLGFVPVDCAFPSFVRAPQIYEKRSMPLLDRTAYYIYDNYLNNAVGGMLAALYRNTVRRAANGRLTSP